ncbi:hypothetical protein HDE_09138 [Halotydeus destructor]|nr:hypothetical protein HDE_09138 [Halotydeus destructor]
MAKGDPARGVSPNQDLKSEIGSVCGNTDECQASEDYLFGKPFWRFVCQCKNNQIVNPKTGRCEYIDLCGQGQEFREKCEAQGKVCRRLGDIRDPEFLCGCAPGQAIDEKTGACADQCSVAAYQRKCSMKNAKCRPNFVKLEPDCVCQDGMTTVNGQVNGCGVNKYAFYTRPLIISPSYAEIMRIKLIRQGLPSFTIDEAPQCENDPLAEACAKYLKSLANGTTEWPLVSQEDILRHERYLMSERIRTSLTNLYLDFSGFNHQGLSLYSFEPATASSYDIKITMPFSDKIDSSTVLSRLTEHCRAAPSVNQQYCTLPGGINIDRSFLTDSEDDPLPLSTEIDPCTTPDGYGRPYCPQGTECKRLEGLSHQCTCGKGTNFLGSVRLNQAGTAFKEICVDLDECTEQGNPCGLNATCVNRVGSFDCECKFGFRKDDQGRCKSVCDGVECGSGTRCVPREGWCPGYSCEIWIEPVVIKTPEPIIETVYIQEKSKPETIIRENRSVPAPEPVKEPEPEPQYSCETVTTCQPAPPDVFRRNTSNKGQTRQVNACNTCGQSSCGCAAGGSCGMCNMAPPTCNIVNAPLPKKELEEEEEESYDA